MGSLTCCARWAFATFNSRWGEPQEGFLRGVAGPGRFRPFAFPHSPAHDPALEISLQ